MHACAHACICMPVHTCVRAHMHTQMDSRGLAIGSGHPALRFEVSGTHSEPRGKGTVVPCEIPGAKVQSWGLRVRG